MYGNRNIEFIAFVKHSEREIEKQCNSLKERDRYKGGERKRSTEK